MTDKKPEPTERDALKYAYRLLRYRDRSEREIREKLSAKGFPPAVNGAVIETLRAQGFVDDRRLAGSLRRYAIETRHLGRRAVQVFMLRRGIPREIVDELTGSEEDYFDGALTMVNKKLRSMQGLDRETVKRRLWGMLSRRGFSGENIQRALKVLDREEDG